MDKVTFALRKIIQLVILSCVNCQLSSELKLCTEEVTYLLQDRGNDEFKRKVYGSFSVVFYFIDLCLGRSRESVN